MPEVLRDWREGKKDRVFWYRAGDGTDPLWIFKPDGSHTVVTEQVRNTLQVVAGDWSGDGVEDLLLYGPGTLPDRVWTSHAGPFTSRSITINGRYQAVAVLAIPFDEVLLFGTGDKPDRYMHNAGSGFRTQPVLLPARGKAYTAGLGAAIVYSPLDFENIVIDDGDTAGSYYLSDSRDVGARPRPPDRELRERRLPRRVLVRQGHQHRRGLVRPQPDLAEAPAGRQAPDGTDRRAGRAIRPYDADELARSGTTSWQVWAAFHATSACPGSADSAMPQSAASATNASTTFVSKWVPRPASMWASAAGRLPAGPVGAVRGERVPHVGHRDDPGLERDLGRPRSPSG